MSLRTFFKTNPEYRVVAGLLIAVFAVELTLRIAEEDLSGNITHILSIPSIIEEVDSNQYQSLVFLGNSLTNRAVHSPIINDAMNKNNAGMYQAFKIIPDNSALAEWYCIYQNRFKEVQQQPRVIIIGFAWDQISDQSLIKPARLGAFFCKREDLAPLSVTALGHHIKQLQFFAGYVSHVYVNREAIRNRLLEPVIPDYLAFTRRINQANNQNTQKAGESKFQYTYQLFTDLVGNIRAAGSDIILMAMPVKQAYAIDENLVHVAQDLGVALIDMRNTGLITNDMYLDPIHLNPEGREIFSNLLAQKLRYWLETGESAGATGNTQVGIRK